MYYLKNILNIFVATKTIIYKNFIFEEDFFKIPQ